jgi:hypothetical protein
MEGPSPDEQRTIAEGLRKYFADLDQKLTHVTAEEAEEIVDEAIRSVRPDYKPIR